MAIVINLHSTEIPVQIGDFCFTLKCDDESMDERERILTDLHKVFTTNESLAEDRDALSEAYDKTFGEGTFANLYELCPSTQMLAGTLIKIFEDANAEMDRRSRQAVKPKRKGKKKNKYVQFDQ